MSFFAELKRRNVMRVGIAYVVVGWLVLQLTDVLSELLKLPEAVGPIVVAVVAIGLPLALFFAWAFELTPEGVKREKDVDRSQSITTRTGRKLDFMIIMVLAVALAYFAADKFLPGQDTQQQQQATAEGMQEQAGQRSIAVLPLVNMSADQANEYFSDGLTEELLNILAKISELQVAGRTSSFAFKGKNEDLRSIAEKLNVDTILEGSVRKDNQRVRITLQLINAQDGYHLWSETYDRNLDDIFAIQEEIAHQVAAALRVTLLGEDEARLAAVARTDLNAYELYLQGLELLNEGSYSALQEALVSFQESSALDSDYFPARLKQARTLIQMAQTGLVTRQQAVDQGQPVLEKALQQDPENDEALTLIGTLYRYQRFTELEHESFRKALDINPRNVQALSELGRSYFNWGQVSRGMEYLREAERIDPYSVKIAWDLTFTHAMMQKPELTEKYATRMMELEPNNPNAHWGMAIADMVDGNLAGSLVHNMRAREIDPADYEITAGIASLWLDLGDLERADHWMAITDTLGPDFPLPISTRVDILEYREQYGMAADIAQRALESRLENRAGSESSIRNAWISYVYDQGEYNQAIAYYEKEIPLAFRWPPEYRLDVPFDADKHLEAAIFIKAKDPKSEQARGLIDAAEQKFEVREPTRLPPTRILQRAAIAAARDDKENALRLLKESVDMGLRRGWRGRIETSILFRNLHREPEFKALITKISEDMDRQRELAHKLMESGS